MWSIFLLDVDISFSFVSNVLAIFHTYRQAIQITCFSIPRRSPK